MSLHAQHLQGVDPALLRIIEAIRGTLPPDFGFQVGESGGLRDEATQRALVNRGSSTTMNSLHRTGSAVDLIPTINGQAQLNDDAAYSVLSQAMLRAGESLGTPLEWGGNWQSFVDKPHYQLADAGAAQPAQASAQQAQPLAPPPKPDIASFLARMSVPGAQIAPQPEVPGVLRGTDGAGIGDLMARLAQPLGTATPFNQVSTSQGRV